MAKKEQPQYVKDVHDVARLIPAGRVTSYGAIAKFLSLGSARMVGWAMFKSLSGADVPAHRVVNSQGELTGRFHFEPEEAMQQRLEAEGVTVENHRVKKFKELLWLPEEILK